MIKKKCRDEVDNNCLEAFLDCVLVPLNKKPGLRPTGVGEEFALKLLCPSSKKMLSTHATKCRFAWDNPPNVRLLSTQCTNYSKEKNLKLFNWATPRLSSVCAYGCRFDVSHALKEVCWDVWVEPSLLELNGEQLRQQTNQTREVHLDISTNRFCIPGQRVFLDVRVFDRSEIQGSGAQEMLQTKRRWGE